MSHTSISHLHSYSSTNSDESTSSPRSPEDSPARSPSPNDSSYAGYGNFHDSSRDGSQLGSSISQSETDEEQQTELERVQAIDRRARRMKAKLLKGTAANGGANSTQSKDGCQLSQIVPHSELKASRPKWLPNSGFTGEEQWQLRKAFDIFANKYRRSAGCYLKRRSHAQTEEEKNCTQQCPNQAVAPDFTLRSFEQAAAKAKGVPLLSDTDQGVYRELTESPSSTSPRDESISISHENDEDMIRMSDYAFCFAAWTGLTNCQSSLNLHLYWTCNKVQQESHIPCVSFSQFLQGFGDYCFAEKVSSDICTDPRVRRKRLFRSLTAEVFESLKQEAHQRVKFAPLVALQEFMCFMLPPLHLLRRFLPGTQRPVAVLPPFETRLQYFIFLCITWFLSVILPLTLPHMDPQYEVYTKSSKLCEVETYGLLTLYSFLGLYWAIMLGSQFSINDWEIQLKNDLDWLSLCRVNSPLGCVNKVRSAKDIFERIFAQVYLSRAATRIPLTSSGELGGDEGTGEEGQDANGTGQIVPASNGATNSNDPLCAMNKPRNFRISDLSKQAFTLCMFWIFLSFILSFPIAFLPTLYRASVAKVSVVPVGETIPILIVLNYMFTSIVVTTAIVNLNFAAFQRFRQFASTLKFFNSLFCLTRSHSYGGSARSDIPYLPLNCPLNVRSWSLMRRYLLEVHVESKVRLVENVYGVLFLATIGGIVFVVVREVLSNTTYASSLLVLYVAMLFAMQLLCMIFAGVGINESQEQHVSLLTEQSWSIARVLLSFPHKCEGEEKTRLIKTEHLLSQLAQTIRHSRTALTIWGIPLQANFRNAILTVTFSAASSAISFWLRNSN